MSGCGGGFSWKFPANSQQGQAGFSSTKTLTGCTCRSGISSTFMESKIIQTLCVAENVASHFFFWFIDESEFPVKCLIKGVGVDGSSLVETSVCKLGLWGEASCFPKSQESLLESKFHLKLLLLWCSVGLSSVSVTRNMICVCLGSAGCLRFVSVWRYWLLILRVTKNRE